MKKQDFIDAWESHIHDFDRLFWNTDEVQKMAVKGAQDVLRKVVSDIAEKKKWED